MKARRNNSLILARLAAVWPRPACGVASAQEAEAPPRAALVVPRAVRHL